MVSRAWSVSCPLYKVVVNGVAVIFRCLRATGAVAGTVFPARNEGFLWVISLLSTLRNPFVTSSPRFRSANTAATPAALGAADPGDAAWTGGGGGGGGGGGPAAMASCVLLNSWMLTPYFSINGRSSNNDSNEPWGSRPNRSCDTAARISLFRQGF